MTEDQKYQGALYKEKPGKGKNEGNQKQGKGLGKNGTSESNGHGNSVNGHPNENTSPVEEETEGVSEKKKRKSTDEDKKDKDAKKAKKEKKNKQKDSKDHESKDEGKRHQPGQEKETKDASTARDSISSGKEKPAKNTAASPNTSPKNSPSLTQQFLSSVDKQLSDSSDCTVYQVLQDLASTTDNHKKTRKSQEKELWRSLRVKKNETGDIVLF